MSEPEIIEVRSKSSRLFARVYGRGSKPLAVVMIPSLGRSSTDFDQLGTTIALHGFTAAALDQRGIRDSIRTAKRF